MPIFGYVQYSVLMTHYKVRNYTHPVGIILSTDYDLLYTFHCWVQGEMDEVVWCFGSGEVHFVPEWHRSLVLPHPLHNQLTLRDPLTFFRLIYVLLGDLRSG